MQNLLIWVSIFSTCFYAAPGPCFHDFLSKIDSKMVSQKLYFLRPPTLLKYCKYKPDLTFPDPGKDPFSRSLLGTHPEHAYCQFLSTFGVHWGTLWSHFCNTFFDLVFRPPKNYLRNLSWQWNGKRVKIENLISTAASSTYRNSSQQRYSRTAEITSTPNKTY